MCIRQASMFDDLRSRLISHGFTNIEYNIINMVKGANKLHELEAVSPNIPVHQETLEDKAVETLGAGKDHFLILDSCNRLVYQVIMPWSFLFYPYVKAAILSAYNDKPCGDCDGHMTEEGYTTVTIIKHIPLLDIFKATFPEQKHHKKHSHLKKHGHHHHHHHHIHSHPHHHHHHHHHDSYPVYYNFEEKDGHKMTVDEQYDALKTFLSQHLHLLNINNDTFEIHSHGSENDYKKFYNTESSFVNSAAHHTTQSGVFDNTVVYTDELTKVPEGTDPIRVEQIEGNVQEDHHTVSKDEVLSQNAPPLQVTLWYPHYHVYNGQRLKDHYFIVLHSKDPKYHGHVVPETTEDKGIGDTFAGEKEHQTGHHVNTTHQFHEESLGHTGGSHSHVGVQTDESHLTGSTSIQGENFGSTHAGEHVAHTTEQNFTSGSQNTFGHGYSYNTTRTETSETHHHSTFDTQSGHKENEIIDDKKKTDLFGKDISATATGAGRESTVSHGSSHGTSVLTADHVSSQSGHHEIAGQAGHGYSTATDSVDENKGIHHEGDIKKTQAHGTINVNKDSQHQGTHTTTHEGTGTETHTHISSSAAGQDHDHKNLDGTSTSGTAEGTSVHTENTGLFSSGSQNQIGGNQHGTNSQSESSAHGDNTQSESSSYSTSQGTYSFSSSSSSSSSSSNGIYPSVVHNTITGDNRDKTVSHEQSGSGQTNSHHQGGQIHHTSVSQDSGSVHNHTTVVVSEQSSGSHDSGIHHTTGGGTEGHKIGNYDTQSQSTHSHQKGSSSSDTSSGFSSSGGSGSHSTSYTTGGHGSSDHSSHTQTSESVTSGGSGSHGTGYTAGGHGSSGHSAQTHASDSGSNTFKHTVGHGGASHSTNYISSGSHDTESQGSYSSYSHGSSQNSTYTHSESAHNHAAGAHVTESEKKSGAGHSSGSHDTYGSVGQSSSSHHGGSSASHGKGGPDDRIVFRDNSHEEFDFHKFLEKQERERKGKTHLRTMDEEDAEPIEKTKDGEELINHYSKILPWIEYPVD